MKKNSGNNFCNRVCSSRYRKKEPVEKKEKPSREPKLCLFCKEKEIHRDRKFCSQECCRSYMKEQTNKRLLESGFIPDTQRRNGKRALISVRGHKCEICGGEMWNGKPMPLRLDHIDGHSENGNISNLRIICANCDAQLPTYCGRNIGNGRKKKS